LSIGGRNETRLWDLGAEEIDPRRIPLGGSLVKFSPDGSLLAVQTGQYNEISVWNVRDVQFRGTVVGMFGDIGSFAFTSDNSRLAVGGSGVSVEPFDASWALRHVCRIVERDLTREEWTKYLAGFDYVPTCSP
jgi:WD40 repeat protein